VQEHGDEASTSCDVHVYSTVFDGTHCGCPWRDCLDELTWAAGGITEGLPNPGTWEVILNRGVKVKNQVFIM